MSSPPTDPTTAAPPPHAAPATTLAHTLDASAPAPPPAAPAMHITGYEVVGELGRGGMGVVYRARQLSLGRTVALKMILAAEHAGAAQVARFRSEAEALARLQHPHIVQIYEIGEHDGRPFFSLEYVDGGSLDRRLDGTPLPPGQAAALIEALARAVHAAHERGVVHRDLKPGNILLAADGSPKITDFGLAKQLGGTAAQTQTGAVLGTPSYMAPEQAGGKKGDVGPATDIYALGAILYELLTGRPPFRAATPLDTLMQVMDAEPVPPSRLQPKLPRDLETICLKCLQKEPRKRYGSALELAEELRRFQAGEPILARPAGALERAMKWARRRPAVAALSAAVVLVTVLGFGGVTAALLAVDHQRRMAENSNTELSRTNQQLLTARANLENANEATKKEAERFLRANSALQRSSYFTNVALAQQLWQGNTVTRAREALDRCPAEHRNWEWHYLQRQCRAELAAYRGQGTTGERLAALSPDGRLLATVEGERQGTRLLIREAVGGRLLHNLPLRASAAALIFHGDGKRLALALEGEVAVCELGEKATVRYLLETRSSYRCVSYTPKGRLLAAGYAPKPNQHDSIDLEVWDVDAGKKLHTLPGFHALGGMVIKVGAMTLGADGKRLAASAFDTGMRVQSSTNPQPGQARKQPAPKNRAHPVPPMQGQIKVWDLDRTEPRERVIDGGINGPSDVAFSPDGRSLAWGNAAAVNVLDLESARTPRVLTGPQLDVCAVAFSPDGHRIVAGSQDTSLRVWDLDTGAEEFALRGHTEPVRQIAFSGDGRRLASVAGLLMGLSGEVKVWDATDGPEARTLRGSKDYLAFCTSLNAAAGRYVIFKGKLAELFAGPAPLVEVSVHRLDDHRPIFPPTPFRAEEAMMLDLSADGKRLAGARDNTLLVLDATTGKTERTLQLPEHGRHRFSMATRPAFSEDGRLLAFAWLDNPPAREKAGEPPPIPPEAKAGDKPKVVPRRQVMVVSLWDAHTGKALGQQSVAVEARPGLSVLTGLVFRPDGKQLAAMTAVLGFEEGKQLSLGGELHFWDIPTLRPAVRRVCAHTLFCGAYSPDGSLFAAGGGTLTEGRVLLCETSTAAERRVLQGHSKDVLSVAFGPDVAGHGRGRLVTGGADGLVKLWDTQSGQEVLTLRGHRRSVTAVAFRPDGLALYSATGFGLLDMAAMDNVGSTFRQPLEIKTWEAPR